MIGASVNISGTLRVWATEVGCGHRAACAVPHRRQVADALRHLERSRGVPRRHRDLVLSTPEQPRQHGPAAYGAGVGCAAASLLRWYTGQHLINVLTASGVAGLAAGAAGGGTAHEVSPFRGSRWSTMRRPRVDTHVAVKVHRSGGPGGAHSYSIKYPRGYQPAAARGSGGGADVRSGWGACLNRGGAPGRADRRPGVPLSDRADLSSDLHERGGHRFTPCPHARR